MLHYFGFGRKAYACVAGNRQGSVRLQVESLEERQVLSASQLWSIGNGVYDLTQTFQLASNPAATKTIYLDFNGHTTGDVYGVSWDNIVSPAWDYSNNGPSFTTTEMQIIQKIWARVAEDFAPFNVNVTTKDPGVEALRKVGTFDTAWGVRVVFTANDQPAPGAGGVGYVGSFNFNTDTPVYVFNVDEKAAAEAATHEVGHSLGLNHDGTGTLDYYSGQGTGATSWGPIMGASYDANVTQWSKGEYAGANNKEDDLAIITAMNGFGYKADDFGTTMATANSLLPKGTATVPTRYGVIERNTDADYFSFWSNAGAITLNIDPTSLGPDLAIRADLYTSAGVLIATVNPAGALNAVVKVNLPTAGQYCLKITGTGKGDPLTTGFSNYASLGNYRITGTVQAYTGTPANAAPRAVADSATTLANTAVTVNVLANDTDANGDTLTITGVSNFHNGIAVVSGGMVVFTPTSGFTGAASFTYTIIDGKGGTASGVATITVAANTTQKSVTNDANVTISATQTSTVTSSLSLTGMTGTLQDVNVKVNLRHSYVSDLRLTLIAPDGTRIILFYRYGGSGQNLINTVFDDSALTSIAFGAAPYTGSFRPFQGLSALNGKNPNGTWKLEITDFYPLDGGYLDNWTVSVATGTAAAAAQSATGQLVQPSFTPAFVPTVVAIAESHGPQAPIDAGAAQAAQFKAIASWLAERMSHNSQDPFELEGDLPFTTL